jgi:tRNA nucleotidyltransferase (CCA-adding enzyme)
VGVQASTRHTHLPLPKELGVLLRETAQLQGAYLVGGCVRDWLLGLPIQDYDIEVFGVDYPQLLEALLRYGRAKLVGRSFGTVKLKLAHGVGLDFTLPPQDAYLFSIHGLDAPSGAYPRLLEAAAKRRDYTINALMYDPRRHRLLDFVGGQRDLKARLLRHTSEAFAEDPLRVLRGMQLAARFDLSVASETVALCRDLKNAYSRLAAQRIWEEWQKWASKSSVPGKGLAFLAASEWLEHFPEIHALQGIPQDPVWHPEGDVFRHTRYACDAMVQLAGWHRADPRARAVYLLAILAHDFGKPETTYETVKRGRTCIVSPGHDKAGEPLAISFLNRIHAPKSIQKRVVPLVRYHLAHLQTVTDRGVRRLARRLEPEGIQGLTLVMSADHLGRPPRPPDLPESIRLLEQKAAALQVGVHAPRPVLMGRDVRALGMPPGPALGQVLKAAYDAQLEGAFCDLEQAYRWLEGQTHLPLSNTVREALAAQRAVG